MKSLKGLVMDGVDGVFCEYWPGLEPLPLSCYAIGSAVLTVNRPERGEKLGVYPMLGEKEAWKAANLLGEGYDFIIITQSTKSVISRGDTAFLKAWNKIPLCKFGDVNADSNDLIEVVA
jgi:hypothetical protein